MKPYEIDAQALKFKTNGNHDFTPLFEHYKPVCYQWYRFVNNKIGVDRDDFYERFDFLLYRSLKRYDPNFHQDFDTYQSKFDRYFMSAVRKLSVTFVRAAMLRRKKPQLVKIEEAIPLPKDLYEEIYIDDLLSLLKDPIDREIVKMRVYGNSRQDVCDSLNIKLHEYRARINKVKRHPSIISLLSST